MNAERSPGDAARRLRPMDLAPLPAEPLVSVVMTSYNYRRYIGAAIESVLAQTYSNFELVICDDGSTDDSCAIVERYAARDPRVRLIRQENGGQASAITTGYLAARGEIVSLIDSDDRFHSTKLEKVVAAFRADPQAGCCLHQLLPISSAGAPIAAPVPKTLEGGWLGPRVLRGGLLGAFLATSGLSFRKQLTDRIIPFPPAFYAHYRKDAPNDMYLLGVAHLLAPVAVIPEPLAMYRFHGGNNGTALLPTAASLRRVIDHFETVHELLRHFVADHLGSAVAEGASLEDFPPYWEHLLGLYLLEGRPRGGVHGYTPAALLAGVPDGRRQRLWRLLLALPAGPARFAFQTWWGFAPWKRWFRPLWRFSRLSAPPFDRGPVARLAAA